MNTEEPYIYQVLRSAKTVWSIQELALLWRESNYKNLYERLRFYKNTGKLIQLRRGFYAKDSKYNKLELANKVYNPSYISLNTVLRMEGIIFQYDESIYSVSYLTREVTVDSQVYSYHKIQDDILLNPSGLSFDGFYHLATKERAFLDALYLYRDYYFDNLNPLNWDSCFDLVSIYSSQAMKRRLDSYYVDYKESCR